MERTFRLWAGAGDRFGVWLPVYEARRNCAAKLEISIAAAPSVSAVPELQFPVDVGIATRGPLAFDGGEPPRPSGRPFISADDLLLHGQKLGVYRLHGPDDVVRITVDKSDAKRRSVLSLCLKHAGQQSDAPFGGTALAAITVREETRLQPATRTRSEWIELYRFPGITSASWPVGEVDPKRCTVRVALHGRNDHIELFHRGAPVLGFEGIVSHDASRKTFEIARLHDNVPKEARLGTIEIQIRSNEKHSYRIPAGGPELRWPTLGHLEPFFRFAEKTGWMRKWTPKVLKRSESWKLHVGFDKSDPNRQLGFPQYVVLEGEGRWPLVNEPDHRFHSPCVLGFSHVLPDSGTDHRIRSVRWLRQWREFHEEGAEKHDERPDPLAPWFEAGFPLLATAGEATVDSESALVLECEYEPELYRSYRETWIADELHLALRRAVGGEDRWDALLGTMQSRGSGIFAAFHPAEVDQTARGVAAARWPRYIGEQLELAVPVVSDAARHTLLSMLPNVPMDEDHSPREATDREPLASEVQRLPAGMITRQGRTPPGLIMVPSGFAIVLHQRSFSVGRDKEEGRAPIFAGAFRTPRFIGEMELSESEYLAARCTVLSFCEAIDDDECVERRPLRSTVALVIPFAELRELVSDGDRAGRELLASLRRRRRLVQERAWWEALHFVRDKSKTVYQWLYEEWRRLGKPNAAEEAFPLSQLLVTAIVGFGEDATRFDEKAAGKAWDKVRKALRKDKIVVDSPAAERRTAYRSVYFHDLPAGGAWVERQEGESSFLRQLPRESARPLERAPSEKP